MFTTNDAAKVYDTIMSIPGINETVKIDMKVSRRNVLLLNRVIERGLTLEQDEEAPNLLKIVPEDILKELNSIADDCLMKAGLTELSEKLKTFK
jgi:hypoxanthine-guanine phosphoribosyltransferase